jgi:hypothetical protein
MRDRTCAIIVALPVTITTIDTLPTHTHLITITIIYPLYVITRSPSPSSAHAHTTIITCSTHTITVNFSCLHNRHSQPTLHIATVISCQCADTYSIMLARPPLHNSEYTTTTTVDHHYLIIARNHPHITTTAPSLPITTTVPPHKHTHACTPSHNCHYIHHCDCACNHTDTTALVNHHDTQLSSQSPPHHFNQHHINSTYITTLTYTITPTRPRLRNCDPHHLLMLTSLHSYNNPLLLVLAPLHTTTTTYSRLHNHITHLHCRYRPLALM